MTKDTPRYNGRAYALMDFDVSKRDIEEMLPKCRKAAETPSELEISVRDVKELIKDRTTDPKLVKCLQENTLSPLVSKEGKGKEYNTDPKRMSDLKYVLEAKYTTHEEAAKQITDVASFLNYTFGMDKPSYSVTLAKAPDNQYYPWTND